MKIFITTDVEVLPYRTREFGIEKAFEQSITDGGKDSGGLVHQLELYKKYEINGIFFVESLFSHVFGLKKLLEIVEFIQLYNQDIQLHLHTEWLTFCEDNFLNGARGNNLADFCLDDQSFLINLATENLSKCGVENVLGFRAGNYGANFETLEALHSNSFKVDTSYNYCYIDKTCGLHTDTPLLQPQYINNILEMPISFFDQGFGHMRHAQLVAVSATELINMIEQAYSHNWKTFVIVSHSFELLNRSTYKLSQIMLRRMEMFFRYLHQNRDRFETCKLLDIQKINLSRSPVRKPLKSNLLHTGQRYVEQIGKRFF